MITDAIQNLPNFREDGEDRVPGSVQSLEAAKESDTSG